jgi:hypothetical protein
MVLFPAACIFPQHGFEVLEGTSSLRLGGYAIGGTAVAVADHDSTAECRKLKYGF